MFDEQANTLVLRENTSDFCEWFLQEPLIYHGRYDTFEVDAGFETDLASVPRIFWSVLPPFGRYAKAAVVHDWLYVYQPAVLSPGKGYVRITRAQADGIFRRIMEEAGVDFITRWTMYGAVRIGGGSYWKEQEERLKRERGS